MTGHRAKRCRGDVHPPPLLKEVERIGPMEYVDPRTGEHYEVKWNGKGPLPGQREWPRRKRDPLLSVINL